MMSPSRQGPRSGKSTTATTGDYKHAAKMQTYRNNESNVGHQRRLVKTPLMPLTLLDPQPMAAAVVHNTVGLLSLR